MNGQIRLILSTLGLSVLIWVYADRTDHRSLNINVQVSINAGSEAVPRIRGALPESPNVLTLGVTVRGPKAAVRDLERESASRQTGFELVIPVAGDFSTDELYTLDLQQHLGRWSEIKDRGLVVEAATKPVVEYSVDRYVRRRVTVTADAGSFRPALIGEPEIEPATVEVRVLESLWLQHGPGSDAARITVSIENQLAGRPGESELAFDVRLPGRWRDMDVTFSPAQVRVSVNRKVDIEERRITRIPLDVRVRSRRYLEGQYMIEWADPTGAHFLQDLHVRVPAGKAEQLQPSAIQAFITIEDADVPDGRAGVPVAAADDAGWITKNVKFRLPDGFEDVQIISQNRTVKLRVVRVPEGREAALPSPAVVPTP